MLGPWSPSLVEQPAPAAPDANLLLPTGGCHRLIYVTYVTNYKYMYKLKLSLCWQFSSLYKYRGACKVINDVSPQNP